MRFRNTTNKRCRYHQPVLVLILGQIILIIKAHPLHIMYRYRDPQLSCSFWVQIFGFEEQIKKLKTTAGDVIDT